ncbi:MAG: site-2 protease family protein [Gemmatimonadetes bacterium]|nr:site-2 protease family protein [Gemmatimonadota bacterium]
MNLDFLLFVPGLLVAIVVHELAHAWQARREGDPTAERLGRITLNPLPHLDLWGSLLVPALLWVSNVGFLFGWAKPVPVDPRNYRDPKWGDVRVSLAGVVMNLVMAVVFTVLWAIVAALGEAGPVWDAVSRIMMFGVLINLVLAFFNLIPIPPLDGSHVVYHLLPPRLAHGYQALGRFGIILLMALIFLVPQAFGLLLYPVQVAMGAADWFVRLWI